MDSLREVKKWVSNKFQTTSANNHGKVGRVRGIAVITPQNVPEFIIPGEYLSRRTSIGFFSDHGLSLSQYRYGSEPLMVSTTSCDINIHPNSNSHIYTTKGICRSTPITPKQELKAIADCHSVYSSSALDLEQSVTNSDPLSFAAISLPHFRMKTSYGFTTLSENPHTRRKESLFHDCSRNTGHIMCIHKTATQSSFYKYAGHESARLKTLSSSMPCLYSDPSDKTKPSVVVTAAKQSHQTLIMPPNSEVVDRTINRQLFSPHSFYGSEGFSLHYKHNPYYYRRRSSSFTANSGAEVDKSDNLTPSYGCHESINDTRRETVRQLSVPFPGSHTSKQENALGIEYKAKRDDVDQSTSFWHTKSKETQYHQKSKQGYIFAPYGELKFGFQYLPASKQLKVTLIKAENLGRNKRTDENVNPYAEVFLMPRQVQKQLTAVIKNTKNPVFNQNIYFHDIKLEDLHYMSLIIRVFSKTTNLKFHEFIGEVQITLDNYDVISENRMWKALASNKGTETLGYLSVGLKFDAAHGILTVYIDQARELPVHSRRRAPCPFIRMEVTQNGQPTMSKQTTTIKNEASPCFKQLFTFKISPDLDAMQKTTVNLSVFDRDRLRGNVLIGQVILGCLATEVEQYGHWQEMIQNPDLMIAKWHFLIHPSA